MEKLELSKTLLEKLEALKKAMENASGLRYIILKRVCDWLAPIAEVQNIKEKLELRAKVRLLEQTLWRREREVKELAEVNEPYRASWPEVQDLRFELSRHRFSSRAEPKSSERRM